MRDYRDALAGLDKLRAAVAVLSDTAGQERSHRPGDAATRVRCHALGRALEALGQAESDLFAAAGLKSLDSGASEKHTQ